MENNTLNAESISILEALKNIKINVNLEGWPAAATVITICLSGVAVYGINVYQKKECNCHN